VILHFASILLNPFLLDKEVLMDNPLAKDVVLRVLQKTVVGE